MRFSVFVALAWATLGQAGSFNGVWSRYSFDVADEDRSTWMSNIPDYIELSALSIPGTHNSATRNIQNDMFQSQNTDIADQLKGGIRYLDVTGRVKNDAIQIYSAGFDTGFKLEQVLATIFEFLKENNRETVILRISKDILGSATDEAFENFIYDYLMSDAARDYIKLPTLTRNYRAPKLGELRGKLFILQDFSTKTKGRFGLRWGSRGVSVSNYRFAIGPLGRAVKWPFIAWGIYWAGQEKENRLHITHSSVALGTIAPYKTAGGKDDNKQGINDWLGQYLLDGSVGRTGILSMDFPGQELVGMIIRRNALLYAQRSV
ncbi:hypothetical protein BROUX41_003149 [Berkeleyomyces rouxiae]